MTGPWEFVIVDDLPQHPLYSNSPAVKAGMQSVLGIPLRFGGRLQATVTFFRRERAAFNEREVPVAKRIARHVALAMSHSKLAAEAKRAAELQAREQNLELVDEMLGTLTATGSLPALFERISALTQKVLAHDALAVPVFQPDGVHATRYASAGLDVAKLPAQIKVPPQLRDPAWQGDVVIDLEGLEGVHNQMALSMGFRSVVRAPVRIDGATVAALAFLSRTPSSFVAGDLLIAKRVADRIALALSREWGSEAVKRADEATERAARLESRVRSLVEELDARTGYRRVVGESPEWREVLRQATQVAGTDTTVLLLGESGTGKEVVARFLHRASTRKDGPFVALNCAALPEHLLEAELFGYERGAFTGAMQTKPGQIEQAAGGVLFLDEVGEMTPSAQAKFLRVLQEREFQRLGGNRVMRADVRVIAATNRDLLRAIDRGTFREDLYYRLKVFEIKLPPLRVRKDDVMALAEAFVSEIGRSLGRPPSGISREAQRALVDYHWPGNVRELRNVLERAAILADGGLIVSEHLALTPSVSAASSSPSPGALGRAAAASPSATSVPGTDIKSVERAMIEKALKDARFNKSVAAKALGITRAQLYVRLKRHGLE